MILFIDTTGFHQLRFALIEVGGKGKAKEKIYKVDHSQSAKTLGYFIKFFGKTKWSEIEKIIVVSGPGSFSGIRVGLAMALAFSLARGIPAFAVSEEIVPKKLASLVALKKGLKKINSHFNPEYGAEPNITPSKKK